MMRSYWRQPDGTVVCGLKSPQLREALRQEGSLLWVDIEAPEDAEIELLLEVFDLHPLTVEDCIMPNVRPKLEEFDTYLFLVLQGLKRTDGKLQPVELDLCVGANFLISIRSEPLRSIDENCARAEKRSPVLGHGPDFLLYTIMESLVESYFPIIDDVESRVDELQTQLLSDSTERTLKQLFGVYNEIAVLRRTLTPHRDIITRLNRGDVPFIQPVNAVYFRDIYDHLLRMTDLTDSAREVTTMALEAHATIVSNRLNEIMKTMSALATLSMPLIIVTGIFGMNFGEHPELGGRWIYQGFSVLLLAAIPVMLFYFRKYRWL